MDNLMTVAEVASFLRVSQQHIRKQINEGLLNAERIGRQWVVSQSDLNNYIEINNVIIEPHDHERLNHDIPEIVALSFFSGSNGFRHWYGVRRDKSSISL